MDRLDKKYGVKRGDTSSMDTPSLALRNKGLKGITYKVVDIPREQRAAAPKEVKLLWMFQRDGFKVSKKLLMEIKDKYPKYFEPVLETNIIT